MKISARMIGLGAAATLIAAVPLAIAHAATESLLSQGRPTTASSIESGSLGAANAVDGSRSTRWASEEGADPQWIRVDLGSPKSISHVVLNWETAYGKAYKIQVSADGSAWTTIYSTGTGNGGTDDLKNLSGTGRYMRLLGTTRGTQWGYSLWELKVYGTGPGGGPSPTATATATVAPTPTPPKPSSSATSTPTPTATPTPTSTGGHVDLSDPHKKDIAMQLVSSAENSSLDWRAQFSYIEDIGDGRGYTAGIIGFCSGTGDMVELVELYAKLKPGNVLAKYLPALHKVDGTSSHSGLDPTFTSDWRTAAEDPVFQNAQESERDRVYFNPAVSQAKADGLRALGQFAYYDAAVMHGPDGMASIRKRAMAKAKTPAQGGSEVAYLNAFLDERVIEMNKEEAHSDTTRVETEQRVFLTNGNLDLNPPLSWKVYGDSYHIAS